MSSRHAWRPLAAACVAALALGACRDDTPAADHAAAGDIDVSAAWARPTPAGTMVGAAYLTLTSSTGDELVGVAVDPSVAASAQVHQSMTTSSNGEMAMAPVADVPLPASDAVTLEPGGYHIMLVDLTTPLVAGDAFTLNLTFDHADALTVTVVVGEP